MDKIRIAIIGAGQISRVTHLPNLRKMPEVDIEAVCDTNENAAQDLAFQFQIPRFYSDHKKMLEAIKPDGVFICVPNRFHCAITMDALNAGCHVLCEKPPAITAEEAKQMEQLADKKERLLSYGFHFRHSREAAILKKKIDQGEFGRIYGGSVSWLRRRGIPGWGSFISKEIQGGGPLIDIGAHLLDLSLYLMNYPEISYVCANSNQILGKTAAAGLMGEWSRDRFTVEDSLFGFIQFKAGYSLSVEASFALNQKEKDIRKVSLYGEKLGASVFPLEIYGEDNGTLMDQSYPYLEESDRHFECARNFVQACLGQEALLISASQGTYIQKVICSLYQSAELKKPIWM